MNSLADRNALILVVERNPLVQRLEKFFLEQAGYGVEFAADGLTALARARELRPTILVTEVLVPKLDGLSLCRQLKSDPATQETKVLIPELKRTLRIIKTRGSAHDSHEHEIHITNEGLVIEGIR